MRLGLSGMYPYMNTGSFYQTHYTPGIIRGRYGYNGKKMRILYTSWGHAVT
jgi:hypothetical protein